MKRLYRSKDDNMLAGVCAGIAEAADIDPTVIRLIIVALTIFTAIIPMLLIYIICAIIIPKNPGLPSEEPPAA